MESAPIGFCVIEGQHTPKGQSCIGFSKVVSLPPLKKICLCDIHWHNCSPLVIGRVDEHACFAPAQITIEYLQSDYRMLRFNRAATRCQIAGFSCGSTARFSLPCDNPERRKLSGITFRPTHILPRFRAPKMIMGADSISLSIRIRTSICPMPHGTVG